MVKKKTYPLKTQYEKKKLHYSFLNLDKVLNLPIRRKFFCFVKIESLRLSEPKGLTKRLRFVKETHLPPNNTISYLSHPTPFSSFGGRKVSSNRVVLVSVRQFRDTYYTKDVLREGNLKPNTPSSSQ